MKKCSKCKTEKELSEFSKRKGSKDGLRYECKSCASDRNKSITEEQKEKIRKRSREWNSNNKEIVKERIKKHQSKQEYKNRKKEYQKDYYEKNKDLVKQRIYECEKKRKELDPLFKLKKNVRSLLSMAIKNNKLNKKHKTENILGCSMDDFIKHLEDQFEPWMTFENQGKYNGEYNYGWDIDHIIPISSAKTEDEVYKLNHYTNLKPLCSKVNRYEKRDKII